MKYKHRFLVAGGPADGPQLPNVFHRYGTKEIEGELYIGLLQEGQALTDPTWFRASEFDNLFEPID